MEAIKLFCKRAQLPLKSTQIFIVAGTVLLSLLTTLLCIGFTMRYEVDHDVSNVASVHYWRDKVSDEQKLWYDKGIEELQLALRMPASWSWPKNCIILLINGIDGAQLAAARYQQPNKPDAFVWERFPHVARLKNSCSASDRCDAGSVATALFGGVHGQQQTVGLDAAVPVGNCTSAQNVRHHVPSLMRLAQLAELRTGFVTNQRLTGATAAALYAQLPDSSWECDANMLPAAIEAGCEDAAKQLLSSPTASHMNVLLGGGRQLLSGRLPITAWDAIDELICQPNDGRNLLRDWRLQKQQQSGNFELVQRESQLQSLNGSHYDYLLGVLANGNLVNNKRAPQLPLMLNKTLEVLQRRHAGYLLLVEQFLQPQQLQQLNDTLTQLLQQINAKETLILVLLTKGNYLNYGLDVSSETELITQLHELLDNAELLQQYMQQMPSDSLLFAKGPKSHLFYGVRDETYMKYAVSYALKLKAFGPQPAEL